ncbi:MAG: hypothetical protein R2688_10320 [Fimbriimonadaceae bacterium]
MAKLSYLTVPDLLNINLRATKTSKDFHFARLEEAVFYQYGHGLSSDAVKQAGNFITGFVKMMPFTEGNEATAFVGMLAFLTMNGHDLHISDDEAADWVRSVWADPENVGPKMEVKLNSHEVHHHHGVPDTRGIISEIFEKYPKTISELVSTGHKAVLA